MKTSTRILSGLLAGLGCGLAFGLSRRRAGYSFRNRVVVITGGSRGLGLVLARELARQGARLALLARDANELERARGKLSALGAEVLAMPCDVRVEAQVNEAMARAVTHFGRVDVLINNAGVIKVGPLEHMSLDDFEEALAIHLFGPLYTTLAALPHMRAAGSGRIVNISSIGGKIAVPHLLPYTVSKFALVGLSDGLRAELRRHNIRVTTVCPGLMRTGSARHAWFKGKHRREYAWFALSDSLPLLSASAERAACKILKACRRGSARLILGFPAKSAVLLNELFPGAMARMLSLANRVLPGPLPGGDSLATPGHQSKSGLAPEWLTVLSRRAALKNNE